MLDALLCIASLDCPPRHRKRCGWRALCLRTYLPECGQAYKELNEVQGGVQAAALPVFLGLSLATSFALTKMAGLASPQQGQKGIRGEEVVPWCI